MYTSRADIEASNLIPSRLLDSVTGASFEVWIRSASSEIDDKVGDDYPVQSSGWKFESGPDTPESIARIARWLAASQGLLALGVGSRGDQPPNWEVFRGLAEKDLRLIRSGDTPVYDQDTGKELDNPPVPITAKVPSRPIIDGIGLEYF